MGAVIGNQECRENYVSSKIEKWIKDVEELSSIARDEPQAALTAYTKVLCHWWTFVQRTIGDIHHLFTQLEEVIKEKFIPAIIGRKISCLERRILSLPVRYGGLGITNPVKAAEREYEMSIDVTKNLTDLTYNQELTLENYNRKGVHERINFIKTSKEAHLKNEVKDIMKYTATMHQSANRAAKNKIE